MTNYFVKSLRCISKMVFLSILFVSIPGCNDVKVVKTSERLLIRNKTGKTLYAEYKFTEHTSRLMTLTPGIVDSLYCDIADTIGDYSGMSEFEFSGKVSNIIVFKLENNDTIKIKPELYGSLKFWNKSANSTHFFNSGTKYISYSLNVTQDMFEIK